MLLEAAALTARGPAEDATYRRYLSEGDPLLRTFWRPRPGGAHYALGQAPPVTAQVRQLHAKQTLYRDRLITTYQDAVDALRTAAVEQRKALGSHAELQVSDRAPSRCPSGASGPRVILSENEVQRGAYHLFAPGAPRQWRRVLAELTPGLGKTCIYVGVMAKFLGRICAETGRYFDIVVIGDEDIFNAFRSGLRSCPAAVNIRELVEIEERMRKDGSTVVRSVLSRHDGSRYVDENAEVVARQQGRVFLRDVNPTIETVDAAGHTTTQPSSGFCAVNTSLGGGDRGGRGGRRPKAATSSPFEREKSEAACGPNAHVWGGSRVVFLKYALAARWIIYTGAGVPAHEAARHLLPPGEVFEDERARQIYTSFAKLQTVTGDPSVGKLSNRDLVKEQGRPPGRSSSASALSAGLMPSEEAVPGRTHRLPELPPSATYSDPGLVANAAHTVFIVDEAHQLLQPHEQRYGDETTRREGIALSEALWRNSDDVYTTPYLFCGTATPNPTTDPSLTACMYQLVNAKLRPTSFLPFHVAADGTERALTSVAEYRQLLRDRASRTELKLRWRLPHERTAQHLVVNPRSFLEPASGFVREMTQDPLTSALQFPLRLPVRAAGTSVVVEWQVPLAGLGSMTYAQAAAKVRECLPDAPAEDAGRTKTSYLRHDVRQSGDSLQNALAHSNFICAARREDTLLQAQRIYKPVYEDDLNRLFLQDMVYNRVFTANSYPDYRYFPALVPSGAYGDPLTRCVDPAELLTQSSEPSPRALAAAAYPTAVVFDRHGQRHEQRPWELPNDSASVFAQNLQRELADDVGRGCRWGERSLWARCDGSLLSLARRLVEAYLQAPHAVDVELEAELQREAAYNSPKLVAAADDLYGSPEGGAYAPHAPIRGKSFYYLNVKDRRYPVGEPPPGGGPPGKGQKGRKSKKAPARGGASGQGAMVGLDDNVFIVVASFYLRLRCRPYLQSAFSSAAGGHPTPEAYSRPGVTLQHGIGWLDALIGQGVGAPPSDAFSPGPNPEPRGEAWALHWLSWRKTYQRQRVAANNVLYVPAFYALADAKMTEDEQRAAYSKYYRYLAARGGGSAPGAEDETEAGGGQELSFDDVLSLLGMPELRKAMVDAQNHDDPCVGAPHDATPAGQSGVFAADNAYKAVDLKCDGFNLCFGPLPRGKRIQQMGRNRRGCEYDQLNDMATKPLNWRVYIRQSFLVPSRSADSAMVGGLQQLLLQDCLLDSFYAEQNEPNEWLRAIAVSASIGCSLWWSYSKWAELLASYHEHVPHGAMDWFFANPSGSACEDAAPPARRIPPPADASLDWLIAHGEEEAAQTGLFRCSRHSTTEIGKVVPSFLGALRAEDVVGPPTGGSPPPHLSAPGVGATPPRPDPTCPAGSAHGYCAATLMSPRAAPRPGLYGPHMLFG